MFESFFRWPDQYSKGESHEPHCLLRLHNFVEAESLLIQSLSSSRGAPLRTLFFFLLSPIKTI